VDRFTAIAADRNSINPQLVPRSHAGTASLILIKLTPLGLPTILKNARVVNSQYRRKWDVLTCGASANVNFAMSVMVFGTSCTWLLRRSALTESCW
jgi:hypothetical protein